MSPPTEAGWFWVREASTWSVVRVAPHPTEPQQGELFVAIDGALFDVDSGVWQEWGPRIPEPEMLERWSIAEVGMVAALRMANHLRGCIEGEHADNGHGYCLGCERHMGEIGEHDDTD